MKRGDWLDRLWETIEAHRALPFRWAGRGDSHDCCTFAAACLDAMTDGTYVDDLLAHYRDETTAKAYIVECGGLAATVGKHLGEEKRISYMSRGDVAIVQDRAGPLVGICIGDRVVSAGEHGLIFNDRALASHAWGV